MNVQDLVASLTRLHRSGEADFRIHMRHGRATIEIDGPAGPVDVSLKDANRWTMNGDGTAVNALRARL